MALRGSMSPRWRVIRWGRREKRGGDVRVRNAKERVTFEITACARATYSGRREIENKVVTLLRGLRVKERVIRQGRKSRAINLQAHVGRSLSLIWGNDRCPWAWERKENCHSRRRKNVSIVQNNHI